MSISDQHGVAIRHLRATLIIAYLDHVVTARTTVWLMHNAPIRYPREMYFRLVPRPYDYAVVYWMLDVFVLFNFRTVLRVVSMACWTTAVVDVYK
jgi:hypothetical protein